MIGRDEFAREISNARVYAGIHYRTATEVGAAMGRRIGQLAASQLLNAPDLIATFSEAIAP
jgi:hypothetical protein